MGAPPTVAARAEIGSVPSRVEGSHNTCTF